MTQQELKHFLHYDAETGVFRWRHPTLVNIKPWSIAGYVGDKGYRRIQVCGKNYRASRLAWFYVYGVWPSGMIDHINGDKLDNRTSNLRNVDNRTNGENQRKAHRQSLTNVLGVSPSGARFVARIKANGRCFHLGSFDTPEQAHAAYLQAKREIHQGCTI